MEQPPVAAMAAALPDQVPGHERTGDVWMACVHPSSRLLPPVGTLVYYYPRGHVEHCVPADAPAPAPAPTPALPDRIRCRITDIRYFFAASPSEDPYAFIYLLAHPEQQQVLPPNPNLADPAHPEQEPPNLADPAPDMFRSTEKAMVFNDMGGSLGLTREMRDLLPALDEYHQLRMNDVTGKEWTFMFGKEGKRLLSWDRFKDAKQAKEKDMVVFMRRPQGELVLGLRRRVLTDDTLRETLFPPLHVSSAVELAEARLPFAAAYYPRHGACDFIVACEEADEAQKIKLEPGTEVRMADPEDLESNRTRPRTIRGTVVEEIESLSAWRNLKVKWHQGESSSSLATMPTQVNQWQVRFPKTDAGVKKRRLH